MAQARTDYPHAQTVCGLMVELTSALVSMTQIQRTVTPEDLEHAREHIMAGLDLAKRLLRDQLGEVTPASSAKRSGRTRRRFEISTESQNREADALAQEAVEAMGRLADLYLDTARRQGLPLQVDYDPGTVQVGE